jgi:hypothetical protein
MTEEVRPTRIHYEDAVQAVKLGANVDFEGRKVRVVSISARTGRHTPYSARLDLDLERVMNSIRNGLGMRETEIAREPSRPWNPHFYAIFTRVHNTL